ILKVDNVMATLQQLAYFHRRFLNIPILALTGSNGKTTTKELIYAVLSQKFRTTATAGNLNNHIGVPLSLLSMNKQTEMGIVEMGANHPGEIKLLCSIAAPDYGYITNFGKAHLEGFGSLEGVIKAKSELYDYLKENNGMLFLNNDDPVQNQQNSYSRTFSFGTEKPADVVLEFFSPQNSFAGIKADGIEIKSKLIGNYNAKNLAAAFSIGRYFKVPKDEIKKALEDYIPGNNRSQIIEKNGNKIILDAYNANPTSMAAALDNFESQPQHPKMAILGDMFELGPDSEKEHQELVNRLENSDIDDIILIGNNFFRTNSSKKIRKYATFEEFKTDFDPKELKNHLLLIKGSRGMALERVLELL
ncbi:MAG TPA: UDP-N-acetylmuramoyl-tripeptide--D-alanyl-D-alanine ligase, partial [Salinimicrobium sp.]|nr:UDP-N-acetylmuramoyl-tripeptide--D-alanyl-D-alanine ligase [Salinimicrobium sp.]